MTERMQYTDERLIAYLMGEGDHEFRAELALALKHDQGLAQRLAALEVLRGTLKQLPVEIFFRRRRPAYAWSLLVRAALLAVIFFTGVLAQSEFSLLRRDLAAPEPAQPVWSGDFPYSPRIVM
jgi:hypothetical protein